MMHVRAAAQHFWQCSRGSPAPAAARAGFATATPGASAAYGAWVPGSQVAEGRVFGCYANEYDAHRPGYPSKMWDEVLARVRPSARAGAGPVPTGAVAVDIATGTGRGAVELARRGLDVIAVDYDQGMLGELEQRAATALKGGGGRLRTQLARAEATGLEDGCADLVVALQSFHWFDRDAALAEFRRLLAPSAGPGQRPGGGLVVIAWNDRDLSVPWMQEYEDIIERHNPSYHRSLKQAEAVVDCGRALTASGLFEIVDCRDSGEAGGAGPAAPLVVPNPTPGCTLEAVKAMNRTMSYVRNALSQSELESLESEMADLVRATFGDEQRTFAFPWVCKAWLLRPVFRQ